MSTRFPQPLYIQACGFHSAMGNDDISIHQCLSGSKPSNMVVDKTILNNGREILIGRVLEPLPTLPQGLHSFDSRNNRLALSAIQPINIKVRETISRYGSDRIAVVIGTSTSGVADGEIAYAKKLSDGAFPKDYHYRKQELGHCSDFVAAYFGITGPHYTVSTACSSSGRVFITAQRLLKSGLVDAVIVGGVDTICRLTLNGFSSLEALSDKRCLPFDADRTGINIGEAASIMLLSHTPAKVALLGAGDSSDAYHISAPHPEGLGAEDAMNKALLNAGLTAEDIGYINAHGTATPLNDSMESKAIYRIFGNAVPVSSTKPLTGHTLGAASATEAAIAWHILNYDLDLPIQRCANKAEDIDISLVEAPTKLCGKAILSNSFAFGGNNVSLIFGYANDSTSPY